MHSSNRTRIWHTAIPKKDVIQNSKIKASKSFKVL
uniref:Uncharacterized protein n=1 Tax=Rhizophora mucronata TaxID=61149 RepID=A0A2P2QXI4_RHIMU